MLETFRLVYQPGLCSVDNAAIRKCLVVVAFGDGAWDRTQTLKISSEMTQVMGRAQAVCLRGAGQFQI